VLVLVSAGNDKILKLGGEGEVGVRLMLVGNETTLRFGDNEGIVCVDGSHGSLILEGIWQVADGWELSHTPRPSMLSVNSSQLSSSNISPLLSGLL
jgi:hypothetical protein